MGKSKIISISAPEDLINFCVDHSISPSELFQISAKQQQAVWDATHTETSKLQKAIQQLQKLNESHWDFLHEKGLEKDYNQFFQEHNNGIN